MTRRRLVVSIGVVAFVSVSCAGGGNSSVVSTTSVVVGAPTSTAPPESTSTTSAPAPSTSTTSTLPLPQDDRWFWIEREDAMVVAVDPSGALHELGVIDVPRDGSGSLDALRVDDDSAVFVASAETLRVFVADGESMVEVPLDPAVVPREQYVGVFPFLVAVDAGHAVLSLIREESSSAGPASGELLWLDLEARSALTLEPRVVRGSFYDASRWFGLTSDGRRVRYTVELVDRSELREVAIASGEVSVVATTPGSARTIRVARFGDEYYLYESGEFHGAGGAMVSIPEDTAAVVPIGQGRVATVPVSCMVDCTVTIRDPFGTDADRAYPVDWAIDGYATMVRFLRVLPDGALLATGVPQGEIDGMSPYAGQHPAVDSWALPLLRVSTDGETEVLGYLSDDTLFPWYTPAVDKVVLMAPDGSSMSLYDIASGERSLELGRAPDDDGLVSSVTGDEFGTMYSVSFRQPDGEYLTVNLAEWSADGSEIRWDDPDGRVGECVASGVAVGDALCPVWEEEADGTSSSRVVWLSFVDGTEQVVVDGAWIVRTLPAPLQAPG